MIHLFLDANAIARRYFTDVGSSNIGQLFTSADVAYITDALAMAETAGVFRSTLADTRFPSFRENEFDASMNLLVEHWRTQYQVLQMDTNTASAAIDLIRRYNLRGADAIHLTLALRYRDAVDELQPEDTTVLVCSDRRLVDASRAEGLKVFHFWQCRCPSCGAEFPVKKGNFNQCPTPGCGFGCRCEVQVCQNTYQVTTEKLLAAAG